MKDNIKDQEFKRFCSRLEELRGAVPSYQTTADWTRRVLKALKETKMKEGRK